MRGIFDRWAPPLITGVVLAIPLLVSLNLDDTFDLPKLSLVYASVILLMALWFWSMARTPPTGWTRTAIDRPLMAFLLIGGMSTWGSLDRSASFFGAYRFYIFGWLPILSFVLLYLFTVQAASKKLMGWVAWAAIVSAAAAGFYGLLQYTGHEIFERMPKIIGGRVWSSLGNPLYLGAVCMMAWPLAFDRWVSIQRGKWMALIGIGMALLFIVIGLMLSLSRSAWLGALVATTLVIGSRWCSSPRPVLYRRLLIVLAGLAVVLVLRPGALQRIVDIFSIREGSNRSRVEGWKGGVRIWRDNPWLGTGPDTFFEAYRPYRNLDYVRATGSDTTQGDAHNDFIQIGATMGSLGVAAFVWVLFQLFRTVIKRCRSLVHAADEADFLRMAYGSALIALFVQDQFNYASVSNAAWAAVFAGFLFSDRADETSTGKGWLRWASVPGVLLGFWAVSIPLRADAFYKRGLGFVERGSPLAAADLFRRAVRMQPWRPVYKTALANTLRTVGEMSVRPDTRRQYLREAWALSNDVALKHPHNPDHWNNRGVAAMWMIQMAGENYAQDARDSFEKALALDPVFVDAWANLAKWEHLAGHLDKEKELWKKVLEIRPDDAMGQQVLGLLPSPSSGLRPPSP